MTNFIKDLSSKKCEMINLANKRFCRSLLILLIGIQSTARAETPWESTHFGTCASEDIIMVRGNHWWWSENLGRGMGSITRYGGLTQPEFRPIDKARVVSRKKGVIYVNGVWIQQEDGSWSDTFYLPLTMSKEICGY